MGLIFYNVKTNEEIERQSKIIVFNESHQYVKKLYIEFDLNDNSGKFMLKGLLTSFNHNIKPHKSLYLNRTKYAKYKFWLDVKYLK